MKKLILSTCLVISCCYSSLCQTFLNGGFEDNDVNNCAYNLSTSEFNASMQSVYSYGINEEADIHTHDCYVTPQSGNWCVGMASKYFGGHDAITLELSSALNIGTSYEIKFWAYGNPTFFELVDSIKIGLTSGKTSFGKKIYAVLPAENIWEEHTIQFVADSTYALVSVEVEEDFNSSSWIQLDNFSISTIVGTTETDIADKSLIYPNPTNGNFSIDLEDNYESTTITIINSIGEVIQSNIYSNSQLLNLNIEAPAGVYLLLIKSEGKNTVMKLVKN